MVPCREFYIHIETGQSLGGVDWIARYTQPGSPFERTGDNLACADHRLVDLYADIEALSASERGPLLEELDRIANPVTSSFSQRKPSGDRVEGFFISAIWFVLILEGSDNGR